MLEPQVFEIWDRLSDDVSKKIFLERLNFSFCGGFGGNPCVHWIDLFRLSAPRVLSEWDEFLRKAKNNAFMEKKLWIFGAGDGARIALDDMQRQGVSDRITLCGFIDNKKSGTFLGKPIVEFDELNSMAADERDCIILIATIRERTQRQILEQIKERNFSGTVCRLFGDGIYRIEYFDINLSDGEIFADVGCCDGTTAREFVKRTGGKYRRIYAFEAEHCNWTRCRQALGDLKDCEVIEGAISDHDGNCLLNISESPGGHTIDRINNSIHKSVHYSAQNMVKCIRLDDFLGGKEISFIKMDIEGAESAALRGAKNTICAWKPKIAVSVYHKPEDIIEIPAMILQFNSGYRFRLRHYELTSGDTVLYAE